MYCDERIFNKILSDIEKEYKILVLMRGLPGSGKSTIAKNIVQFSTVGNPSMFIFSTDDFFMKNGRYVYNPSAVGTAHEWNQNRVRQSIKEGLSPIIIDNTNLEAWEMMIYCRMAMTQGYLIETLEAKSPWALNPGHCARRNKHNVPAPKIKIMLEKYQRNLDGVHLLKFLNLTYPSNIKPPLPRSKPLTKANCVETPHQFGRKPLQMHQRLVDSKNAPTSHTSAANQNCAKKSNDLIDFTNEDDSEMFIVVDSTDIPKNMRSTEGVCETITIDDDDDDSCWTDCWEIRDAARVNGKSVVMPKPQRNPENGHSSKCGKFLNGPILNNGNANWATIDESFSSWMNIVDTDSKRIYNTAVAKCDANTSTKEVCSDDAKVLIGRNKDINGAQMMCISHDKPSLDKGNMVDEETINNEINDCPREQVLDNVMSMFSHVPKSYMRELLEKCGGNADWLAELLLDYKSETPFVNLTEGRGVDDDDSEDVVLHEEEPMVDAVGNAEAAPLDNAHSKKSKTPKKDKSRLKKQIEGNFKFSDEHYSEHYLKLKRRHQAGGVGGGGDVPTMMQIDGHPLDQNADNEERPMSDTSEETTKSGSEEMNGGEKLIQFRMGKEFVNQLNDLYDMSHISTEGLEPIVNMPESLANQIYALWLESICNQREQLNSLSDEDEEFARQLDASENQNRVTNFNEIIDMELAFAMTYPNRDNLHDESTENLATKLTQLKLVEMFPDVDRDTLLEVYRAHDNKFNETFEVLLLSTGKITQETLATNPATLCSLFARLENELLERAKQEKHKAMNSTILTQDTSECQSTSQNEYNAQELEESVKEYRKEAQLHLNIRNTNHEKARQYHAKGMTQVAKYYSDLASAHTKKYEQANTLAASALMQLNISGSNYSTLDLHYFFVAEALTIMDVFIDNHISKLRDNPEKRYDTETLYLVTGRGRHSLNRKARIKPAVQSRLTARNLRYFEVNPGLLGVCVTGGDKLTNDNVDEYSCLATW